MRTRFGSTVVAAPQSCEQKKNPQREQGRAKRDARDKLHIVRSVTLSLSQTLSRLSIRPLASIVTLLVWPVAIGTKSVRRMEYGISLLCLSLSLFFSAGDDRFRPPWYGERIGEGDSIRECFDRRQPTFQSAKTSSWCNTQFYWSSTGNNLARQKWKVRKGKRRRQTRKDH